MNHCGSRRDGCCEDEVGECFCSCPECSGYALDEDDVAEYMSHSDADPGL